MWVNLKRFIPRRTKQPYRRSARGGEIIGEISADEKSELMWLGGDGEQRLAILTALWASSTSKRSS
jgi:hypothetical protein